MAEAFNSLFKAELVRKRGPWKSIDDLEIAVAEYIDWDNFRPFTRRDRARPTRRVRNHPPQHHPPKATRSAGVPSLHQTQYLTGSGPTSADASPALVADGNPCRRTGKRLFALDAVPVTRYRYQANIPTPWGCNPDRRQLPWRARCVERRTAGSASGLGKRTLSNQDTPRPRPTQLEVLPQPLRLPGPRRQDQSLLGNPRNKLRARPQPMNVPARSNARSARTVAADDYRHYVRFLLSHSSIRVDSAAPEEVRGAHLSAHLRTVQ